MNRKIIHNLRRGLKKNWSWWSYLNSFKVNWIEIIPTKSSWETRFHQGFIRHCLCTFISFGEGLQSSFRAVSEQFQSSFRAVSVQFKELFAVASPKQFQSSFGAFSEQFQSSFSSIQRAFCRSLSRAVSEQFRSSFGALLAELKVCCLSKWFSDI